ncbi:protein-L-isoaspartate O-methyltransferase [Hamadaea flava]|uniref:Protein-L-isoaspartate O-methyltransferase n=1 Tax=Hamadaea flava TaxID=1742688 RepID=A0ABV8LZB1_9ACTN|nr:methyltransferase domain-containing protein [Hamadaea flava]MCP2326954.1 protein-L-isoaspartate O-methyltransferase [Hamadaea flava]
MTAWQPYAEELAETLTGTGVLAPGWREAFLHTPRHVFVPYFYDGDTKVAADSPEGLKAVYADESLVTQLAPDPRGADYSWPTSSSTRPSLMAQMLSLLDVTEGEKVLEIGTGTGYNAALLSYRLGDTNVISIDIDPTLVETARARLADLGHRPFLTAGDGAAGVADRAPYSRIIATAAVATIPPAWISQLVHGGRIVTDIRGELASALLVADKNTDTSVRGRFRDTPGHFMWLRARADNPLRLGDAPSATFDFTNPQRDSSEIPADAFDERDFLFLLQLAMPSLGPVGKQLPDGRPGVFLHSEDDYSWVQFEAKHGDERTGVAFGGPRALWPQIAELWQRWYEWKLPGVRRFGMTAYTDGRCHIWLDHEYAIVLTHTNREEAA